MSVRSSVVPLSGHIHSSVAIVDIVLFFMIILVLCATKWEKHMSVCQSVIWICLIFIDMRYLWLAPLLGGIEIH